MTEEKPKLLFTDLDQTLLCDDKSISQENLKAIDEMVKRGHRFVIATGRPTKSALTIAGRYGFDKKGYYISSFNGGIIYDCGSGKDILTLSVKKEDVKYILDKAHESGIHAHTYDRTHVISEYDTPEVNKYSKGVLMPKRIVKNILTDLKEDPIKMVVISYEGREILKAFHESIKSFADERFSHTFSNPFFLEYENIKASKGQSLRYLASLFGIPAEDTIACGDEENDLSMIEAAGTGVVMVNGTDYMKSKADYITSADNNHDGIAEVIDRFILKKEPSP